MQTVTYLPEVECEVRDGIWPEQEVISIRDVDGNRQFFAISKGFASRVNGDKTYVSVGIVRVDQEARKVLVELPHPADSGAMRMWIPFSSFRRER